MKRIVVMIFLTVFSFVWDLPVVSAQFLEAGVEKFRVTVEAADFTLKELDGEKISLKELRGKLVLLNFFAPY